MFLIGTPVCRTFSTLIEWTQAGKPSEFELKSFLERCVTHLKFCFRTYETQRNAGRLFLHVHPWDAKSRGLSYVNGVAEKDGVHKTKGDFCRFQLATNSVEKGSWFMSNSECRHHRGVEQALPQQKWPEQESHELCGCCVERPEEREIDSVKAIGSMEVGVTCEEPNVLELDEYAEEV